MNPHRLLVFLAGLCLSSCGGAQGEAELATGTPMVTETRVHKDWVPAANPPPASEDAGVIKRAQLRELLAKGPAHILAQVALTPVRERGKFVGYRIDAFHTPLPPFMDLKLEDVVTEINGRFVNRPEAFFEVFEELKVASEIRFAYYRKGKLKKVSYPVTD